MCVEGPRQAVRDPAGKLSPMTGSSLIAQIAAIGTALGFEVDPEHWTRINAETGVYRPRIDCLWAASLSQYGYDTTPLRPPRRRGLRRVDDRTPSRRA
jgi:hypothetical protein